MKLWQKENITTSKLVETFTVGNDLLFDDDSEQNSKC